MINALTSFFMCPIKIAVYPRMNEGGPKPFQPNLVPSPNNSIFERRIGHWRAQKRDIIFMLSPCVSTPWLPWSWLPRESEERDPIGGEREKKKKTGGKKKRKKEKEAKIGGLTGPSLQTPRVLIATHCHTGTMDDPFVTCLPKPSHRKTIESNREESDRCVFKTRSPLRFYENVPSLFQPESKESRFHIFCSRPRFRLSSFWQEES